MVAWKYPQRAPIQGVADLANGFGGGSVFRWWLCTLHWGTLLRNNVANTLTTPGCAQLSGTTKESGMICLLEAAPP